MFKFFLLFLVVVCLGLGYRLAAFPFLAAAFFKLFFNPWKRFRVSFEDDAD